MEKKKLLPAWITIVNIIFAFAAAVLIVLKIATGNAVAPVCDVIFLIALVCGVVYCLRGYKKSDAVFFRIFTGLTALGSLVSIASLKDSLATIAIIGYALMFAGCCAFTIVKDMGKVVSNIICAVVFIANVPFLYELASGENLLTEMGTAVCTLVISIILWIMISAKYADKAARK